MSKPIDIVERLRARADDPMWAHHAEIPKRWCSEAAAEITRLRAALAANRQDWDRVHHALAKHGKHPGRTDDHLADVIDRAFSAAPGASPPPAALAVPAGMALVPVEPTPEMLYPDLQTAGPGTQLGDMCAGFGREIWARMLAASQESATTRGGVSRNAEVTGLGRNRSNDER